MRAKSTTGIYAIVHTASDRRYVGSAINVESRWDYHRSALTRRRHTNAYLTAAWHKYGIDAFEFIILELVRIPEFLTEREQSWIDRYQATDRRFGFNIAPKAGSSLGVKFTPEQRAKLSIAIRGRKHTPETRSKISASNMGRPGRPTFGLESRSLTAEQALGLKQRLAEGISAAQVSRESNVPLHTVHRLARGTTYPDVAPHLNKVIRNTRPEWRTGDRNPHAKLAPTDVQIIRRRLADGEQAADIARDFGVSGGLIGHIKRRLSWKWLPENK